MSFSDYVTALRQRAIIIVLCALIGGVLGFAMGKTATPVYQSTARMWVTVGTGENVDELVQGSTVTQNLIQSYAELAGSAAVLTPVIEQLGLSDTPGQLANRVSVSNPINTVTLQIVARSSDPKEAADIANAVADQLPRTLQKVTPGDKPTTSLIKLSTITPATLPKYPISPNTRLYTLIGLLLGGAVGVGYAVLRQLANTRVRDSEDLAEISDIPVLGVIPTWRGNDHEALPVLRRPLAPRAEAYRRLRSNLDFVRTDGHHWNTLVVTSPSPSEGKSTTAANLALAIGELGQRVLLIDADMRRPSVATVTGLNPTLGLSSVLSGRTSLASAIQPWAEGSVDVVTAGGVPPNPLQLLESDALDSVIAEARVIYEFVIVDAPPLLSVVDPAVLSRKTDGAIVIAQAGGTKRRQLKAAIDALDVAGITPVGLVLTRAAGDTTSSYQYYAQPTQGRWHRVRDRLAFGSRRRTRGA